MKCYEVMWSDGIKTHLEHIKAYDIEQAKYICILIMNMHYHRCKYNETNINYIYEQEYKTLDDITERMDNPYMEIKSLKKIKNKIIGIIRIILIILFIFTLFFAIDTNVVSTAIEYNKKESEEYFDGSQNIREEARFYSDYFYDD